MSKRFDRLVLDAVEKLGPCTGYQVEEYVSARRFFVTYSGVYLSLYRMEDAGILQHARIVDDGGKARHVYSLRVTTNQDEVGK